MKMLHGMIDDVSKWRRLERAYRRNKTAANREAWRHQSRLLIRFYIVCDICNALVTFYNCKHWTLWTYELTKGVDALRRQQKLKDKR